MSIHLFTLSSGSGMTDSSEMILTDPSSITPSADRLVPLHEGAVLGFTITHDETVSVEYKDDT